MASNIRRKFLSVPMCDKVSIVIVNWNSGDQLFEAIESLNLQKCKLLSSVIIVDNASVDNSLDKILSFGGLNSNLKIIRNFENKGFAAACNQGARLATGKYLLFLNPDAKMYPGGLRQVLNYMDSPSNATVGICGVQLIDGLGHVSRSCTRFPSPFEFFFHAVGLDRIFHRMGHFMNEWAHDTTREVDHLIGAFYFVRRSVFENLKGFDERFFVYLEDLDFSYRARKAGWRSVYLADVKAFHAGGGTSNQVKARRLFYSLRSRLLYAFKHFGILGSTFLLLATMLIEPLSRSVMAIFVSRSWSSLQETWSAYGMLWRWLLHAFLKSVVR